MKIPLKIRISHTFIIFFYNKRGYDKQLEVKLKLNSHPQLEDFPG